VTVVSQSHFDDDFFKGCRNPEHTVKEGTGGATN
jgi:hypothetical protein